MADSVILSRLPAKGAAFTSAGSGDAYKLILLNSDGKIDSSLVSNSYNTLAFTQVTNATARLALIGTIGQLVYETSTALLYICISSPNNWALITNTVQTVNTRTGAITLSKSDVGLSNVDNTSDANKPVSSAQETAINKVKNQAIAFSIAL
jgi:hypothetical protein